MPAFFFGGIKYDSFTSNNQASAAIARLRNRTEAGGNDNRHQSRENNPCSAGWHGNSNQSGRIGTAVTGFALNKSRLELSMISMRSIYALKALTALARERHKDNFLIADIAHAENIPKKFLEAILLSLKVKGILASKKGPKGGYSLAQPADKLTIGHIIETLEGDLSPIQCLNGASHAGCPECLDENSCGVKLVMADVKQAVGSVLDTVTLADMLSRSETVRAQQTNIIDYAI